MEICNEMSLCILFIQGVVTAAISLITCLSQKNPDEFKTCVSLAVSRLSRVSMSEIKFLSQFNLFSSSSTKYK